MRARFRFAILIAIVGVAAYGGNAVVTAAGQDELAEVRRVTAQFHRVEAATDAGYELGYVNGAGSPPSPPVRLRAGLQVTNE